jgi:hypothetical protein
MVKVDRFADISASCLSAATPVVIICLTHWLILKVVYIVTSVFIFAYFIVQTSLIMLTSSINSFNQVLFAAYITMVFMNTALYASSGYVAYLLMQFTLTHQNSQRAILRRISVQSIPLNFSRIPPALAETYNHSVHHT